jgi:dTDP-L-rhamnose 4-epimerase
LPEDLQGKVELIIGDVRDKVVLHEALLGKDIVVHLAAETGTGQSMYEPVRYEQVNIGGTALLLDFVTNNPKSVISKMVVASSRAIYGEGKYHCVSHGDVYPNARSVEDLKLSDFEPKCPLCGISCAVLATDEGSVIHPSSLYGISKQVQEQMFLMYGNSLGISAYALRYQNVYGPGQSLNNPYTGILAIFSNLARNGKKINIFEDGLESRDFVYIDDVIDATMHCIEPSKQGVDVFNVGSGVQISVLELMQEINYFFGGSSHIEISGDFRVGDIRHNYADLTKIKTALGFVPKWSFSDGVKEFLKFSKPITEISQSYNSSIAEMKKAGLYFQPSK